MEEEEKSFEDIWDNSLLTGPATDRDVVDLTASPQKSDKKSREVQLLQAVIDKYGEKLGPDVTVDDMVSELISSKPVTAANNKTEQNTLINSSEKKSKSDSTSEKTDQVVEKLREDTRKIMKIVTSRNKKINVSFEEVYAYVEAHFHKVNRVQLVVEEFLEMHGGDDRSSSPEIIEVEVIEKNKSKAKGKGKGVGKKSSKGSKRTAEGEGKNDPQETKKIKLIETSNSDPDPPRIEPATKVLYDNFILMFPQTPRDYILARVSQLVGKEADLDNFMEELLFNPDPPEDWKETAMIPSSSIAVPTDPDDNSNSKEVAEPEPEVVIIDDEGASSSREDDGQVASSSRDLNLNPLVCWMENKEKQLASMFPDVSPDYLLEQIESVIRKVLPDGEFVSSETKIDFGILNENFATFVDEMFGMDVDVRKNLPSRTEFCLKKKEREELEKWSGNMSVDDMLVLYSDDPDGYFTDPNRKPESQVYREHALEYLKKDFRFYTLSAIKKVFKKANSLYFPAYKILKEIDQKKEERHYVRKTKRHDVDIKIPKKPCIEFLKEKKFVELQGEIVAEKKRRASEKQLMFSEAQSAGRLVECLCCYDEYLPDDMIPCKSGHMFCRECVTRGTNVAVGDGKTIIECLGQCKEEIDWPELQKVLAPNVLSKLLLKRQAQEVEAADLQNLVYCPFCPYVTIMDSQDDKVLVCRNPECGRESCRQCREPNHVPLRCEEVEKDEEMAERKRIEEKLTAAMMRECWRCGVKYTRVLGCNRMTCPKCGAAMCYICRKPNGGHGSCPCPETGDNNGLHQQEVATAAAEARQELQQQNLRLRHDPTTGVEPPRAPGRNTNPLHMNMDIFDNWQGIGEWFF